MINVLAEVGNGVLPKEKWKQLYESQPDEYRAHLHQAIIYANSELAQELLPDLKERADSDTYLQNVFSTVRHRYNSGDTAEKELEVRGMLLEYASRDEWVSSEFGKGH